MANEAIELYKPYEPAKMHWPALIQRKLDGVPVRIRNIGGHIAPWTRQNEVITSIPHIFTYIRYLVLPTAGSSITGELYIDGVPFKTISGLARKKVATDECRKLVLHIFDADLDAQPAMPYEARMARAREAWANLCRRLEIDPAGLPVRFCPGVRVDDPAAADRAFQLIMQACPTAEGAVLHSLAKPYQPGTRRWNTQKMKPRGSIDLRVVGFEEAVSKVGQPLGMVGRINCEFSGIVEGSLVTTIIGAGPGALKHSERKKLWQDYVAGKFKPRIGQFGYMPDDTYAALREPTFERWRDDKSEPNTEGSV